MVLVALLKFLINWHRKRMTHNTHTPTHWTWIRFQNFFSFSSSNCFSCFHRVILSNMYKFASRITNRKRLWYETLNLVPPMFKNVFLIKCFFRMRLFKILIRGLVAHINITNNDELYLRQSLKTVILLQSCH